MAAAQEGGSTVSECWLAASRINFADGNSWHREWMKIADASNKRAAAALSQGNLPTARSNWLRAVNYYHAAAYPYRGLDRNRRLAIESMRECAADYLRHRDPPGEIVRIPWLTDYPLQAYYMPARASSKAAPAVICIGEPGTRKEEYLSKVARYALERGMSLLAVDLMGEGTGVQFDEAVKRYDLKSAIGSVMDYLISRDDIDEDRIAIFTDACGSSFVARGIASDGRFAAAVCDGGLWDMNERAFATKRSALVGIPPSAISGGIMRNIHCPVLITLGERGWLRPERATELFEQLKTDRNDVTLKIFTSAETAAAQGHIDNPTLANEFIFDWIASRLGNGTGECGLELIAFSSEVDTGSLEENASKQKARARF